MGVMLAWVGLWQGKGKGRFQSSPSHGKVGSCEILMVALREVGSRIFVEHLPQASTPNHCRMQAWYGMGQEVSIAGTLSQAQHTIKA